MFKIKICGITNVEDALLAAEAGADAIGLNFYEKSPRCVTPEKGGSISRSLQQAYENRLADKPSIIGVFVHPQGLLEVNSEEASPLEMTMLRLYEARDIAALDGFQLHGNEPPELVANMNVDNVPVKHSWLGKLMFPDPPATPIIRAFRCHASDLQEINQFLHECASFAAAVEHVAPGWRPLPQAILVDAHQPGSFGGTGQVADWNMIREQRDQLLGVPLILAGGLTPENVAEAIATARPDAVDVASGVESTPGKKDPVKVRAFVEAAKRAFAELDG